MRRTDDPRLEAVDKGSLLRYKSGHPVKALESPQNWCHRQRDKVGHGVDMNAAQYCNADRRMITAL